MSRSGTNWLSPQEESVMKTMFHLGQTEHIAAAQKLLKGHHYGYGQTLLSTISTMTQHAGYIAVV